MSADGERILFEMLLSDETYMKSNDARWNSLSHVTLIHDVRILSHDENHEMLCCRDVRS